MFVSIKWCSLLYCPASTVVEYLTHNPKIEGLDLTIGTGRDGKIVIYALAE
jgi:hypothetical protein